MPAEFTGRTKKRNIATVLYRDLKKKKENYCRYFELNSVEVYGKMYHSILKKTYAYLKILLPYV